MQAAFDARAKCEAEDAAQADPREDCIDRPEVMALAGAGRYDPGTQELVSGLTIASNALGIDVVEQAILRRLQPRLDPT